MARQSWAKGRNLRVTAKRSKSCNRCAIEDWLTARPSRRHVGTARESRPCKLTIVGATRDLLNDAGCVGIPFSSLAARLEALASNEGHSGLCTFGAVGACRAQVVSLPGPATCTSPPIPIYPTKNVPGIVRLKPSWGRDSRPYYLERSLQLPNDLRIAHATQPLLTSKCRELGGSRATE